MCLHSLVNKSIVVKYSVGLYSKKTLSKANIVSAKGKEKSTRFVSTPNVSFLALITIWLGCRVDLELALWLLSSKWEGNDVVKSISFANMDDLSSMITFLFIWPCPFLSREKDRTISYILNVISSFKIMFCSICSYCHITKENFVWNLTVSTERINTI